MIKIATTSKVIESPVVFLSARPNSYMGVFKNIEELGEGGNWEGWKSGHWSRGTIYDACGEMFEVTEAHLRKLNPLIRMLAFLTNPKVHVSITCRPVGKRMDVESMRQLFMKQARRMKHFMVAGGDGRDLLAGIQGARDLKELMGCWLSYWSR